MHWVGGSIGRIGRKRTEAIVKVYQMTGHLPRGFDEVLPELVTLVEGEEPEGIVTTKDCIAVMLQLNSFLDPDSRSDGALLSFILDDKNREFPWTK